MYAVAIDLGHDRICRPPYCGFELGATANSSGCILVVTGPDRDSSRCCVRPSSMPVPASLCGWKPSSHDPIGAACSPVVAFE